MLQKIVLFYVALFLFLKKVVEKCPFSVMKCPLSAMVIVFSIRNCYSRHRRYGNMVEKLTAMVVSQMARENIIRHEMKEHYIYVLTILAEKFITIFTIVGISLIVERLVETVIFFLFFFALRKRTGGYHAKNFWQCYLKTIITYLVILWICPILSEKQTILYGFTILSVIVILYIGTVNHPNMDMTECELCKSRKMARWTITLESVVVLGFSVFDITAVYASYMSMAIILCAFLLGVAKLIKQEVS